MHRRRKDLQAASRRKTEISQGRYANPIITLSIYTEEHEITYIGYTASRFPRGIASPEEDLNPPPSPPPSPLDPAGVKIRS